MRDESSRPEITLSRGRITKVVQKDHAVFLEVDLVHHQRFDGTPLQARCRLFAPYHGKDFGDWWLPEKDQIVLCLFDGPMPHGGLGDPSDGIALAISPTKGDHDLPKGHEDDSNDEDDDKKIGEKLRVHRGRKDEALDVLRRGETRVRIDAAHRLEVTGDRTTKISGDEDLTIEGDLDATVEGDSTVTLKGDLDATVKGDGTVTVEGDLDQTVQGDLDETCDGDVTWSLMGKHTATIQDAVEWTLQDSIKFKAGSSELSASSSKIAASSSAVELGMGALLKLIDERLIILFNTHTHKNAGSGVPEDEFLIAASGGSGSGTPVTTQATKAA